MHFDDKVISELFNGLFQLGLLVITGLVIPWVKTKVGCAKFERMALLIGTSVRAAEQIYGRGEGSKKLEYVVNFLRSKGVKIDETTMQQIESAVFSETKKYLETTPKEEPQSCEPMNS